MKFSKCSRYAIDWQNLLNDTDIDILDLQSNSSWPTEYCLDGWIYNKTYVTSSIVIDVRLNEQKKFIGFIDLLLYNRLIED